ncbi:MAG: ATP-binding protein [Gammaproteobacteria bacterium]
MKIQPKTVFRLMLVSFLMVSLPLIIGLLVLFFQIDRLSIQMQSIVNQSAAVMENSRLVTTQALSLKRSAEQYLILLDRKLLARYEDQRQSLQQSVEVLLELPIDLEMSNNLHQVARIEERLHSALNDIDANHATRASQEPTLLPEKPLELDQLAVLIGNIPAQASEFVALTRGEMAASAARSKKSLIALLVTIVPTAVFLALISGTIINRPIKKVFSLIRRMGEGEYPRDTHVGGPKDIEALGEQLHWLSERLSQIEQQKVTFLQNVSHELKTPLTAIREGADLMQEQVIGKLNPEQLEVLEIMNQNTYLLQNQLESLLDFNLALTMDEPFPQVPVNIKMVIEKSIEKLHLILKSRQLTVEHNTPAARIIGNQAQLESLFENLLTNAIKFSPRGGTIKIATEVTNDGIDVEIQDAGPGFSKDEVKKVFKPFYQGTKSPNSHIKGTGLGLSIAKRYADLHGGRIEIANSAIGAAVKVLLPVNNMKMTHET